MPDYAAEICVHCNRSIIKSYYIKNGHYVAAFIIERSYGKGNITFANISGYLRAISEVPGLFSRLAYMPSIPGLKETPEEFLKDHAEPFLCNVGNLNMSRQGVITSSSLLFLATSDFTMNDKYYQNDDDLANKRL